MSNKTVDVKVTDKKDSTVSDYIVEIYKTSGGEINCPCTKIVIFMLVFSILVGFVATILVGFVATILCCCYGVFDNVNICNIVKFVINVLIFLSLTGITLVFTANTLKSFVKMALLKEMMQKGINKEDIQFLRDVNLKDIVKEELANEKDLIKKFCDTLSEL